MDAEGISTFDHVRHAYIKLKAHIYNEYGNLFIRSKLAQFESQSNFEDKLRHLSIALDEFQSRGTSEYIETLIESISYNLLPKKLSIPGAGGTPDQFFLTNDPRKETYDLEKIMIVIDCPIEIHVISVLWTMKLGSILDEKFSLNEKVSDVKYCYGHRLIRDEVASHGEFSKALFVPYYQNYKNWRDDGLKVAKALHEQGVDSVILTLDIKSFFYKINFNVQELDMIFWGRDYEFLNKLLAKTHLKFKTKINSSCDLLPIGLLSSGIIANHVLHDTDSRICSEVKPAYYGRYVDDFIIVLPNVYYDTSIRGNVWLAKLFSPYKIFGNPLADSTEIKLENSNGDFSIQFEKVRIISLSSDKSLNIINEFERNIRETSSEARLLVENAELLSTFDSESTQMSYSDSIHKLRSLDAFNLNKLGASSFLTNLIEATKITHKVSTEDLDKFQTTVMAYFCGVKGLESYHLWEKVITFFILQRETDRLFDFIEQLVSEITKVRKSTKFEYPFDGCNIGEVGLQIRKSFLNWVAEALKMGAALDPYLISDGTFKERISRIRKKNVTNQDGISIQYAATLFTPQNLQEGIWQYRESNLIRHKYVCIPLINYCKQGSLHSLVDFDYKELNYNLEPKRIDFSPRYISFHEIQIFYQFNYLAGKTDIPKLEDITERYIKLNHLESRQSSFKKALPQKLPLSKEDKLNWEVMEVRCQKRRHEESVRVGIANIRLDEANIVNALNGRANLNYDRLIALNKILNNAVREGVQLMVLPEIALPFQWIDFVSKFCQKHFLGLITGIEHQVVRDGKVANLVCHILPFEVDNIRNVVVSLRNKQNFSPEESRWLNDQSLEPFDGMTDFVIFDWCGLHFTTFNCFEITDLSKRTKLVGNVDMVAIIENNKDTEYFSNIVESASRDMHSIIVQVNNSEYGDSRVCVPAKSYWRDRLRLKGGVNQFVAIEELDIYGLRLYQMMGESAGSIYRNAQFYKPKPPNYSMLPSRRLRKIFKHNTIYSEAEKSSRKNGK